MKRTLALVAALLTLVACKTTSSGDSSQVMSSHTPCSMEIVLECGSPMVDFCLLPYATPNDFHRCVNPDSSVSIDKNLFDAVAKLAQIGCGMDVCYTEATNIHCLVRGDNVNDRRYECVLDSEVAGHVYAAEQNSNAETLYNGLVAKGLQSDCDDTGTCKMEAKKVSCRMTGNNVENRRYSCTFEL